MVPDPIPKCPNCHFAFAADLFTKEEIIKLKTEFKGNNIFEVEPNMPKYYYLAREGEFIHRDKENIVWWFLSAVWENKDETLKKKLINITIEYINKLNEADEIYNTYQMVKLDLLRRSGQFDDALQIIEKIKMNTEFYKDIIIKIIDYQIELIKTKDKDEHSIPQNN
ncbi:hypothetical protein FACS1894199_14320 [Bacteroidia bacterium]|nr:hypothetical protein FACS1894199_14320 [Bacteroidia bacterium]